MEQGMRQTNGAFLRKRERGSARNLGPGFGGVVAARLVKCTASGGWFSALRAANQLSGYPYSTRMAGWESVVETANLPEVLSGMMHGQKSNIKSHSLQSSEVQPDRQSVVADAKCAVAVATPPLYHDCLPWDPILDGWGETRVAFAKAVRREALKLRKEVAWEKNTPPDNRKRLDKAAVRRKVACFASFTRGPRVRCVRRLFCAGRFPAR